MTETKSEPIKVANQVPEVEGLESDGEKKVVSEQRQDAYVVFAHEKDLRHFESIRIKASLYTGIAVRVKNISPGAMDNLLHAIELDGEPQRVKRPFKEENTPGEEESARVKALQKPLGCIINLRFEECRFTRKAAAALTEFMKNKQILETMGFHRISFEDVVDFKKIMEGIQQNGKLSKLTV